MNENWYKDIMAQKYQYDNYFDPTKLFVALAFTESGELKQRYPIKEIAQYVYRYYIANLDIARHNFNIVVRNIEKYGVDDIYSFIVSTVNQWIKEQKYNSLSINDTFVFLNLDEYDDKTVLLTRKTCEALFQKYYKTKLNKITDYSYIAELDDSNLEIFGKSNIRYLIFEDMQYCPLTEITDEKELYVVHILPKIESAEKSDLINKDNLLLLSKEMALEYIQGLFYFDEFGRVVSNGSKIASRRMRLSISLITEGRKEYIQRHFENMKRKGG